MTDNVIPFPRELSKESYPVTEAEYVTITGKMRESLSDEITESMMQNNINMLFIHGLFGDIDDLNVKDAIFLEETLRAIIYRYKNIDHPFHEVIDDIITMPDEEEAETSVVNNDLTKEESGAKLDS